MSETIAVPLDALTSASGSGTGQPLCPSCVGGYLHPFRIEISLSRYPDGWNGANYLTGWVAVCVGSRDYNRRQVEIYGAEAIDPADVVEVKPCGFSMPMTPQRYDRRPT